MQILDCQYCDWDHSTVISIRYPDKWWRRLFRLPTGVEVYRYKDAEWRYYPEGKPCSSTLSALLAAIHQRVLTLTQEDDHEDD